MEPNLDRILLKLGVRVDLPEGELVKQELLSRLALLPTKDGNSRRSRSHREFLEHFCAGIEFNGDCWSWTRGVANNLDSTLFKGDYGVVWHKMVKHNTAISNIVNGWRWKQLSGLSRETI